MLSLKSNNCFKLALVHLIFWASQNLNAQSVEIQMNQIGFTPNGYKSATVKLGNENLKNFNIFDESGKEVFKKDISSKNTDRFWEMSGQNLCLLEFPEFVKSGNFILKVYGTSLSKALDSTKFAININIYHSILKATIRYFYLNRASAELPEKFAGKFSRPLAHQDNNVKVHSSAADSIRKENTELDLSGGWYDAGDYNKYIVNSSITCYTLLQAYENNRKYFNKVDLNIPNESNNSDFFIEIKYNIDWMLKMQDPSDGGVYHKLTEKKFSGFVKPEDVKSDRYVVLKTTAASLDFAALIARFARLPENKLIRTHLISMAENAYRWAEKHPNVYFKNPSDVFTGAYDDEKLEDEWFWAKAELWLSSNEIKYIPSFKDLKLDGDVYWADVKALGLISLANSKTYLTRDAQNLLGQYSQKLVSNFRNNSGGQVFGIEREDFVWGSNAVACNQSLILIETVKFIKNPEFQSAAWSNIHYVLGQNPFSMSYVTGFGKKSPLNPHHRLSFSDGVEEPQPGMLVGGPNYQKQDKNQEITYSSDFPAMCYTDELQSYASNEVAINWNAPLVYVLSFAATQK